MEAGPSSEEMEELQARPYQNELLEKAKKNNIIVYLGTGSGKTYIANLLIKDFRGELTRGKKAIFLVSSLPLVDQQAESLRVTTGLSVGSYCGADGVDDWTEERWREEISKHQVLVLIHQVFLDTLTHAYFKLSDAVLLILDECHHAQSGKNHPYTTLMKDWYHPLKDKSQSLPKVLGLTASLMVKSVTPDKFHKEKRILEELMDCKVETTEDLYKILKYVTAPEEKICCYPEENNNYQEVSKRIESYCNVALGKLAEIYEKEKNRLSKESNINLQGTAIQELKRDFKMMKNDVILNILGGIADLGLISVVLKLDGFMDKIQRQNKALRVFYKAEVRMEMDEVLMECLQLIQSVVIEIPYREGSYQSLVSLVSSKVLYLVKKIKEESRGGEIRRTIVFVEKQYHAETLSDILRKFSRCDDELSSILTDFAFSPGSNLNVKNPSQRDTINNNRRRLRATLAKFKDGRVNTLISTSVIEEGLDVRTCNLVIKFDFPMTFRSYVQSKGRARAKPSKYILMVSEADAGKFSKKYGEYRDMEELSLKECHHTVDEEEQEQEEDFDNKPYVANPDDPDSARINGSQAVRLIHKYIQKIPVDRFTRLTPVWREDLQTNSAKVSNQEKLFAGLGCSESSGFLVTCHMPHKTPFSGPVKGVVRPSKKAAKHSTAKLICEVLHQRGELDHRLKVRKRNFNPEDEEEEDEAEEEGYNPNNRKTGTRKKRRFYLKEYPEELQCQDSGPHYLHVINVELVRENQNFKYKSYHPEQDRDGAKFGLISTTASPPCGPFQLFPPSGEHQVLVEGASAVRLDKTAIEKMERFQEYLWRDVLKVSGQMDRSKVRDLLVVPIRNSSIDFDLLDSFSSNRHRELNEDSVIYPKYKEKKENYFIEETVPSTKLNIDSKVPGESFSFRKYYQERHNLTLQGSPLIRPSSADKKSYMLIPGTLSARKSKSKDPYYTTLFPEEVMGVEPISGGLWRQAQLLPFILHRFQSLTGCSSFLRSLGYLAHNSHCLTLETSLPPLYSPCDLLQLEMRQGKPPSPGNILTAVTLKAANDMFDMERLEILGDGFLKYYTGVFLYYKQLELDKENILNSEEGDLTRKRSRIVGNKNLFKVAEQLELEKIVIAGQVETDTTWCPPGLSAESIERELMRLDQRFKDSVEVEERKALSVGSFLSWISHEDLQLLPGDGEKLLSQAAERFQANNNPGGVKLRGFKLIGDKSLADCVESLIGTFLLNSGQTGALEFMSKIGINLSSDNSLNDVLNRVRVTDLEFQEFPPQSHAFCDDQAKVIYNEQASLLYEKLGVREIERIIGYKFREPSFLLQAFTHASYGDNRLTGSYERLEYIGDAVLDYLVTVYVYAQAGSEVGPGRITDIRSALVNNNMFASVLVDNKLHTYILLQSPLLQHKVDAYVEDRMQESSLHRDFMLINEEEPLELELVEVPKVLGDVLESLIGAIYIDSGHDLRKVWEIYRKLCVNVDEVIRDPPMNPKKELMEKFPDKVRFSGMRDDRREKMVVTARIEKGSGKAREFRGLGENKSMATLAACKLALRRLS